MEEIERGGEIKRETDRTVFITVIASREYRKRTLDIAVNRIRKSKFRHTHITDKERVKTSINNISISNWCTAKSKHLRKTFRV